MGMTIDGKHFPLHGGRQGPPGPQGETGPAGPKGDPGIGVPEGGSSGQVLTKTEDGTEWKDPSGGGGTSDKIGDIKLSVVAPGENWLKCDGRVISKDDYPDLAGNLINLYGSEDKFDPSKFDWIESKLPGNHPRIKIAYGDGIYAAVASTGQYDYYTPIWSTDGKHWVDSGIPWWGTTWRNFAYGNGTFVIVGVNGELAWSIDGKNWVESTMPSNDAWSAATYGNGLFVALSMYSNSSVALSTDGKIWAQEEKISTGSWCSAVYGNGLFVAVANDNKAAWSTDGKNWTKLKMPGGEDLHWNSVTFGNGLFVAAGPTNLIAWSTDGKIWTLKEFSGTHNFTNVAYGGGTFVATTSNGTVFYYEMLSHARLPNISIDNVPAYIKAKE